MTSLDDATTNATSGVVDEWGLTQDMKDIAHINTVVYYSLLIPVALCGNLFTLISVIMVSRLKKSVPNMLIGVLAFADLLSLLAVHSLSIASMAAGRWLGGDNLCRFQSVMAFTYFKLGFISKISISLDRLVALKYPLKYRMLVTTKKVVAVIAMNVAFSFLSSGLTWIVDPQYIKQLRTWYMCTNDFSIYTDYKLSIIIVEGTVFMLGVVTFFASNITVIQVMLILSKKLKKSTSVTSSIGKIGRITTATLTQLNSVRLQETKSEALRQSHDSDPEQPQVKFNNDVDCDTRNGGCGGTARGDESNYQRASQTAQLVDNMRENVAYESSDGSQIESVTVVEDDNKQNGMELNLAETVQNMSKAVKPDRKSTRLNSSHVRTSRMPSSA